MNTADHIAAAAAIAGPMAAASYSVGQLDPMKIQQIAKTAVQIASEIERQVRAAATAPR
jgi:hypothetical protein